VSKPRPVRITGSAARAIAEAAAWWTANRPKAPEAFADEVERALQLIAVHPGIGARAMNVRLAGVRRIHLARIRYHLYYRVAGVPEVIEVLALWHTSRGSPPPIER
jgi:plasmid stabilization system protein ParE